VGAAFVAWHNQRSDFPMRSRVKRIRQETKSEDNHSFGNGLFTAARRTYKHIDHRFHSIAKFKHIFGGRELAYVPNELSLLIHCQDARTGMRIPARNKIISVNRKGYIANKRLNFNFNPIEKVLPQYLRKWTDRIHLEEMRRRWFSRFISDDIVSSLLFKRSRSLEQLA
jgi:hypothetical protein